MRDHAWIDFSWQGKHYRYSGEWPIEMQQRIGEVWNKASSSAETFASYGDFIASLIKHAGATILEIHSLRPDGSIHAEDLPDLKIH